MESSSTTEWLLGRPKWQQVAVKRLSESDALDEATISDLTVLCQQEANDEFPTMDYSIPANAFDIHDSEEIRLCSISEIAGVNKLAPRRPLNFGDSNLTVVYGLNGSGKSGYTRLLKHICGARDCIRDDLLNNVFSTEAVAKKATISFRRENSPKEDKYEWVDQGASDDLRSVDIFDSSFGRVFMENEGEVSYEPPALSFFSRLIKVCDKVAAKLDTEASALESKMPSIPNSLRGSDSSDWVGKISANTSADEIENYCSFTFEDETRLQSLQKRISEHSPADKAKQLANKKKHACSIIKDFKNYLNQLSDENCKRVITAQRQATLKKSVADAAAEHAFSEAPLKGVGSDVWMELWNAARKYSDEVAYEGKKFPFVQNDSVCVLCHQSLTKEAKLRFATFESYIKEETQKQAVQAESDAILAIDTLPDIPSTEVLKTKIDAAGIDKQEIFTELIDTAATLQDRKIKLPSATSVAELTSIILTPPWLEKIQKISQGYEESANKYSEDAEKGNREELQKDLKDLQAKKWLAEQKTAIQEEVNRRQKYQKIQEAKKLAYSITLSKKKGELAETLITDAFIDRFKRELKGLKPSGFKVEPVKSRVSKGKVLHTIKLVGADEAPLNDVLSEGENRIVSIAAFLADVTGRKHPSTFVFDDPISSLDENYEKAVIKRLCSISSGRQVIIFTHRLSLSLMLQGHAKKQGIEPKIICISAEEWGTGEPGDAPFVAQKPVKALNCLIDQKLPEAKNILEEDGSGKYKPYAVALCREFRNLLERMIEHELMSGIVRRYERGIRTKGIIGNLAKISEEDCNLFDELMTKYSSFVHSQPDEVPVPLPKPDELESDFEELRQWRKEFKKRVNT